MKKKTFLTVIILFLLTSSVFSYGSGWLGLGTGTNSSIKAMVNFQGNLIAAGTFINAGGQPMSRIASWNGTTWNPLAEGINGDVNALTV